MTTATRVYSRGREHFLRDLPIETADEQRAYLEAFEAQRDVEDPYGTVLPARWKPMVVRSPWAYTKAAVKATRGHLRPIPRETWERMRIAHGLPTGA
jgi:hypothetical protein